MPNYTLENKKFPGLYEAFWAKMFTPVRRMGQNNYYGFLIFIFNVKILRKTCDFDDHYHNCIHATVASWLFIEAVGVSENR